MRINIVLITVLCLLLSGLPPASGEEKNDRYKIVFSTFERGAAGDYSYLRDSIQTMLASRLAARDRVEVLEKTFNEKELASMQKQGGRESVTIGGEEADYLVTGALFSLISGLNIQIVLHPLVPEKEILRFSIVSKDANALISDVESLSEEIAQEAFGYQIGKTEGEGIGADVAGNAGFVTVHPEAAYKKSQYTGTVTSFESSGLITKARGVKKSKEVPVEMTTMAVGDADGDGSQEIIFLSGQKLRIFKQSGRTIDEVAQISLPLKLRTHAVNLADLDGDGKEEMYVSGTDGLYVSSMIMEWDGKDGFTVQRKNIPWYLRPLFVPKKGWVLIGQKRGFEKIELIAPGVYFLTLDAQKDIVPGARLPLPKNVNLFDFVYADIDGDSSYETVTIDQKEKLKVYNSANQLMWVSKKDFGGSQVYLGPSQGEAVDETSHNNFTTDEDFNRELIFVPGRIIVSDIDKDGKDEIIINESKIPSMSFLTRLRLYSGGALVGMAWDGAALTEAWRTGNFRGHIGGHSFSLLEEKSTEETVQKDGKLSVGRLFVGHLPASGSLVGLLPGTSETHLTIYDLEFSQRKTDG